MNDEVICEGLETCTRPQCHHNKPHEPHYDGGMCNSVTVRCSMNKKLVDVKCIPYQNAIIDVDELFEEIDI
jgi:hypothetical protein